MKKQRGSNEMHWKTLEDNGKPMRNEGKPPNPLENHWKTIGKQRTSNENKGKQMKTIGEHWKHWFQQLVPLQGFSLWTGGLLFELGSLWF